MSITIPAPMLAAISAAPLVLGLQSGDFLRLRPADRGRAQHHGLPLVARKVRLAGVTGCTGDRRPAGRSRDGMKIKRKGAVPKQRFER